MSITSFPLQCDNYSQTQSVDSSKWNHTCVFHKNRKKNQMVKHWFPFSMLDLDGKLYDAYVAYPSKCDDGYSNDVETFAIQTLPQVLEKACGYKLFIAGRDCQPGQGKTTAHRGTGPAAPASSVDVCARLSNCSPLSITPPAAYPPCSYRGLSGGEHPSEPPLPPGLRCLDVLRQEAAEQHVQQQQQHCHGKPVRGPGRHGRRVLRQDRGDLSRPQAEAGGGVCDAQSPAGGNPQGSSCLTIIWFYLTCIFDMKKNLKNKYI